jgi:hypothetical protein
MIVVWIHCSNCQSLFVGFDRQNPTNLNQSCIKALVGNPSESKLFAPDKSWKDARFFLAPFTSFQIITFSAKLNR